MLKDIARIIHHARNGVVLTGAGISAESGLPTFRGKEGLWGSFKAEELATMEAFMANPKIVWEWYNWRREVLSKAKPNSGHYALVDLAKHFDRYTLITQNVDGLHNSAGSTEVLELHGNINSNRCLNCNAPFEVTTDIDPENIPCCKQCGGKIRPNVVWFGEMLPEDVIELAFKRAEEADVFFIVGTSALVHPAATLPTIARQYGATLVEINPEPTPLSDIADFHFPAEAGKILPQLINCLNQQVSA